MDLLESTPEAQELKKINRTKARTVCIITLTFVLSKQLLKNIKFTKIAIFSVLIAILNFQGHKDSSEIILKYEEDVCSPSAASC